MGGLKTVELVNSILTHVVQACPHYMLRVKGQKKAFFLAGGLLRTDTQSGLLEMQRCKKASENCKVLKSFMLVSSRPIMLDALILQCHQGNEDWLYNLICIC